MHGKNTWIQDYNRLGNVLISLKEKSRAIILRRTQPDLPTFRAECDSNVHVMRSKRGRGVLSRMTQGVGEGVRTIQAISPPPGSAD